MCKCPVHIINPTLNFTLRDKITLDVPCGKCSECRQQQQNSWFVRSFYQYLETEKNGGKSFYITLTYRTESLPHCEGVEHPVHDKVDVQRYLKRVRKMLDCYRYYHTKQVWRKGKWVNKRVLIKTKCLVPYNSLKYMICSEYGDKRKRPHYHGVIHIMHPICGQDINTIKHVLRLCWEKYCGYVSFGRKNDFVQIPGVIQSSAALHYVVKYVSKDIDFDYEKNKDIPSRFKPFHLQSKGYGSYMIEYLGLNKTYTEVIQKLIDGKVFFGSEIYGYAIPQYITRKVLYNYNYDRENKKVTYTLNDIGLAVKRGREQRMIEEEEKNIYDVLHSYASYITSDERLYLLNSRCGTTFQSVDDIGKFLSLSEMNYTNLAHYAVLFKDRLFLPCSDFGMSPFDDEDKYTLDNAREYLDFLYCHELADIERIYSRENGYAIDLKKVYLKSKETYSLLSRSIFTSDIFGDNLPYEIYLEMYNTFQYFSGLDKTQKYLEKESLYRETKMLSNELI